MGATLRVAEPFLKIFRDGSRGVRVDDPDEVQVVAAASQLSQQQDVESELLEGKKRGNGHVAKKQYDAAMDVYLDALHSCSFVPTVLSNRAQAYISLGQYERGILDASASLTIRPSCKKTWTRYDLCLKNLRETIECAEKNATQLLLERVLDEKLLPPPSSAKLASPVDSARAEELKFTGNAKFKLEDFEGAINFYSEALSAAGGTVRALLSNWSMCALEVGARADAIAAAAASIRISVDEKAFYRLASVLSYLGHYDLSLQVAEAFPAESKALGGLREQVSKTSQLLKTIQDDADSKRLAIHQLCLECSTHYLGTWAGPCETFQTKTKGRGVRALSDMKAGDVVFIERPLAFHRFNLATDGMIMSSSAENTFDVTSDVRQKETTVMRCKRDGVLSRFLSYLSDGSKQMPLVPVKSIMMSVNSLPLLLPGHHEYLRVNEPPRLSADKIQTILGTNQHGNNALRSKEKSDFSELYPSISMMNHSSSPTCTLVPPTKDMAHVAMVLTVMPVKKGGELTIMYHDDENVVMRKWGIAPGG